VEGGYSRVWQSGPVDWYSMLVSPFILDHDNSITPSKIYSIVLSLLDLQMAEPKSFFRKLLKRPNLSLRRSTGTPDPSTAIQPNDVHAFEKIWLDIHVSSGSNASDSEVITLISGGVGCTGRTGRKTDTQGDHKHRSSR
jgi:hypothetical protein